MSAYDELWRFNVRGTTFLTSPKNFQSFPNTKLGKMSKFSNEFNSQKDEFFIDRNPFIFHAILDLYITGELHIPKSACAGFVRKELEFWEINESCLHNCCWKSIYDDDETCKNYDEITDFDFKIQFQSPSEYTNSICSKEYEVRKKLWSLLQKPGSNVFGKVWYTAIFLCVTTSVLVFGLSTTIFMRIPNSHVINSTLTEVDKYYRYDTMDVHPTLFWADLVTNCILLLDWFLRFYSCPNKKTFIWNIFNLIEFIVSISIFYITYEERVLITEHAHTRRKLTPVKVVYALRVFRIFRLLSHTRGMKILHLCIKTNYVELIFFLTLFLSVSSVFALLIYFAEIEAKGPFVDFFESVWWAVITLSSVGYGDMVPSTIFGHAVGVLTTITGILLLAIPIVVIAASFGDYYNCFRIRDKYLKTTAKLSESSPTFGKFRRSKMSNDISLNAHEEANELAL